MQFFRLHGKLPRKVIVFTDALRQIKQLQLILIPGLYQLVIAEDQRGLRGAGNGMMEKQERVVARHLTAAAVGDHPSHAAAIQRLRQLLVVAGQLRDRRENIQPGHGRSAHRARLHARADHNKRNAYAPLVHRTLAVAQGMISMKLFSFLPGNAVPASIVGQKENVGGVLQTERFDLVENHADARIHIARHGGELRHRVLLALLPSAGLIEGFFAIENVQMNGVVGHLHKERVSRPSLLFHEVAGSPGNTDDQLGIILRRRTTGALASTCAIAGKSVADVVTHLLRRDVVETHVPLAEMSSPILGIRLLEQLRKAELLPEIRRPVSLIFLINVSRRSLANQKAAPRRTTKRRRRITPRESHAHFGQPFDVRRPIKIASRPRVLRINPQRCPHPALVVSQQNDEVGRFVAGVGRA